MNTGKDHVIFVSYRHNDRPTAADRIYSQLKGSLDVEVFKDSDSIHLGKPIPEKVREYLGRATILIPVIGPDWFKPREGTQIAPILRSDDWVRKEITTALKNGIAIVPVYVEGAKLLNKDDLPRSLKRLAALTPDASAGSGPRSMAIRKESFQSDLDELVKQLAKTYRLPHKYDAPALRETGGWQPSRDWQLRHLDRLEDELRMLSPAIPPRAGQQQWPLDSVFVPLELKSTRGVLAEGEIDWDKLIKSDRVALTGGPGAGKSTLLRHLVLDVIRGRRAVLTPDEDQTQAHGRDFAALTSRIPMWLNLPSAAGEIRRVKEGQARTGAADGSGPSRHGAGAKWYTNLAVDDWLEPVSTAARLGSPEAAKQLLDTGDVLLICDGLDEIADPEERDEVLESLVKLPNAYGRVGEKNPVVVGCREDAWGRGRAFAPFDQIQIRPMDSRKWEQYLDRWCGAVWDQEAPQVLEKLRYALRSSWAVQEMAANPQTATMLAVLAGDRPLPEQRVRLYDEFVGRALDNDRLQRYGGEPVVRQHLIDLAVEMQGATAPTGRPLNSLSESRARLILGQRLRAPGAKELTRRKLRELGAPLLADIALHTGLIAIDRSEGQMATRTTVRFRHRTVQEFLVACHFVDDLAELLKHVTDPAWLVPVALTAGLLAKDDEEALEDFVRNLIGQPERGADRLSERELVDWGRRVSVLSACLEELSCWDLPECILAPARSAHEAIGKRFPVLDLPARVKIAEGMGIIGDPRLKPGGATRWVQIGAGRSTVGSASKEAWRQEQPEREVQLSEFWIQRWPVTVCEYGRFVEDAGGYRDDQWWDLEGRHWRDQNAIESPQDWESSRLQGNRPITGVSWWETRAYVRWLSSVEELPERWAVTLPTEAQWERAARGPFGSPAHRAGRFPWGDTWDPRIERANCDQVPLAVCPVGLFPAGNSAEDAEDIWDLAGNVGERCLDGFGPPDVAASTDPCPVDYRFGHAVRGGDYASSILDARVSARFPDSRESRSDRVGFRCVAWQAPQELR